MKLTILGSGTAVPSLQRNSAGLLLQTGQSQCLIDCGYGTLHQLLRLGLSYHDIDRIFFTHVHPDHICDLIPFLFASKYPDSPRTRDLALVGAPGFGEFFRTLQNAFRHWLKPDTYRLEIVELDQETMECDDFRITPFPVRHMDLSRGYRFENPSGPTLAVSGDTDYCESLIDLGRGADLMVLECSFPDDKKVAKHLTPGEAGRIAERAKCKTLCLTHFFPPCEMETILEQCQNEYSGEIILAKDLLTMEI